MKKIAIIALTSFFALLFGVLPASAQKQKKQNAPQSSDDSSMVSMSDSQRIDENVSEMLGYWQDGMVDQMQKYYSPDVIVVSGAWEPPVSGWTAYAAAYQSMRARIQGGQLDRTNTYVKVEGNTAWVTYQWEYFATIDGQQDDLRGHTTLFFVKQGDNWLIALDHTSVVSNAPQKASAPAATPQQAPANSGPGAN